MMSSRGILSSSDVPLGDGNEKSNFTTDNSYIGPTFTWYKGHMVRYNTTTPIHSLWSLFTTANSILQSRRTWVQIFYMFLVGIIAFLVVHIRGLDHSVRVADIASEVRILASFVMGGYVLECFER